MGVTAPSPRPEHPRRHRTSPVPLGPRTLGRVLLRPRNAGLSVYRGEIVGQATWPPILDPDTWRASPPCCPTRPGAATPGGRPPAPDPGPARRGPDRPPPHRRRPGRPAGRAGPPGRPGSDRHRPTGRGDRGHPPATVRHHRPARGHVTRVGPRRRRRRRPGLAGSRPEPTTRHHRHPRHGHDPPRPPRPPPRPASPIRPDVGPHRPQTVSQSNNRPSSPRDR